MKTKTNLLDLIEKDEDEISNYLGGVEILEFISDVKSLVSASSDKEAIKMAIEKLQQLL